MMDLNKTRDPLDITRHFMTFNNHQRGRGRGIGIHSIDNDHMRGKSYLNDRKDKSTQTSAIFVANTSASVTHFFQPGRGRARGRQAEYFSLVHGDSPNGHQNKCFNDFTKSDPFRPWSPLLLGSNEIMPDSKNLSPLTQTQNADLDSIAECITELNDTDTDQPIGLDSIAEMFSKPKPSPTMSCRSDNANDSTAQSKPLKYSEKIQNLRTKDAEDTAEFRNIMAKIAGWQKEKGLYSKP